MASAVVPSIKVTLPVGVPVPEAGVTLALKVTLVPAFAVLADAVSDVVVAVSTGAVAVTATDTAVEVLLANVELPAYAAVIE